jgi:hypothetical protein
MRDSVWEEAVKHESSFGEGYQRVLFEKLD